MIKAITTERLIIKPLELSHASLRSKLLKEPGEVLLYGADPYPSEKIAQQHTTGFINMNKTGFSYHWTIENKATHQAIGFCDIHLPAPHLLPLRVCAISYGIMKSQRRQGFAREALNACLNFIFNTEQFYRVEATVLLENQASLQLLESMGFKQEGIQRKKWLCAGARYDVISLALLRDEFEGPPE